MFTFLVVIQSPDVSVDYFYPDSFCIFCHWPFCVDRYKFNFLHHLVCFCSLYLKGIFKRLLLFSHTSKLRILCCDFDETNQKWAWHPVILFINVPASASTIQSIVGVYSE